MTNTYITELRRQFAQHADTERAVGAKAYMRNQYAFFGIPTPLRRSITKAFRTEHPLPEGAHLHTLMRELWSCDEREFQYFALDSMYAIRKQWTENEIVLFEYFITHKSWWDTVDFVASKLVGEFFRRFPQHRTETVHRWIAGDNMWLNRTAIIFQLSYKQKTDLALLEHAILPHSASKEFFLQKAIGWALRQYSYTDGKWVQAFVSRHPVQPLSVREALKALRRRTMM